MSKPALTWNLHLPDMSVDRKKGAGLKKRKICSVLILFSRLFCIEIKITIIIV